MKLSLLLDALTVQSTTDSRTPDDPTIHAICYDSRKVKPGTLFVAIQGYTVDGHRFVDDAVARGAVAVVASRPVTADAVVIQVDDSRAALAQLADRFYGHPSRVMTMVGVTGTNGKTTVTYLLERILAQAVQRPGVVGTINCRYAGRTFDTPVTTPESLELQAMLRQMTDAGVSHVAMEVSSHALDMHRVDGCRFDLAVFTNLSQDHLDHHGDMQRYWACKKRLFTEFLKPADGHQPIRAVVSTDDAYGQELAALLKRSVLRTAAYGDGDVVPLGVMRDLTGIHGKIATPMGEIPFRSPLVGDFNLENILTAAGAALALGIGPEIIGAGIDATPCVPGRLERVEAAGERTVFVDYAHTPDALENAIGALRNLTTQRLITVFGCGGDRDNSKRPIMGEIAARNSDLSVVTSDNPRTEDPLAIIDQVEVGVRTAGIDQIAAKALTNGWQGRGYLVEADRKRAIELAIRAARPGDAVLIAGKGHETYQILGTQTVHFDDREAARIALAELEPKSS